MRKQKAGDGLSPAGYLLQSYLRDVMAVGRQVSLEVLNQNEVAWRLYEKKLAVDENSEQKRAFELLGRSEIEAYAALREAKPWGSGTN
jgi:ribosomal protein S18 acetylase RimI-like enzyme